MSTAQITTHDSDRIVALSTGEWLSSLPIVLSALWQSLLLPDTTATTAAATTGNARDSLHTPPPPAHVDELIAFEKMAGAGFGNQLVLHTVLPMDPVFGAHTAGSSGPTSRTARFVSPGLFQTHEGDVPFDLTDVFQSTDSLFDIFLEPRGAPPLHNRTFWGQSLELRDAYRAIRAHRSGQAAGQFRVVINNGGNAFWIAMDVQFEVGVTLGSASLAKMSQRFTFRDPVRSLVHTALKDSRLKRAIGLHLRTNKRFSYGANPCTLFTQDPRHRLFLNGCSMKADAVIWNIERMAKAAFPTAEERNDFFVYVATDAPDKDPLIERLRTRYGERFLMQHDILPNVSNVYAVFVEMELLRHTRAFLGMRFSTLSSMIMARRGFDSLSGALQVMGYLNLSMLQLYLLIMSASMATISILCIFMYRLGFCRCITCCLPCRRGSSSSSVRSRNGGLLPIDIALPSIARSRSAASRNVYKLVSRDEQDQPC